MRYEDGVDKETLFKLIKEYNRNFSAKWITSYITFKPEEADYTNDSGAYRRDVLKCTDRELMLFDNIRLLKSCIEKLDIKSVLLKKTGEADEEILKSNIGYLGLNLSEKAENYLDFRELFSRGGIRTGNFYKYEILNNINAEGVYEKDGVAAYKKDGNIYIILLNRGETGEINFNIRLEDKSEGAACIVKIVRVRMPEDYDNISGTAGNRAISLVSEPEIEYCTFENLNEVEIKETVKGKGICLIIISKLNG